MSNRNRSIRNRRVVLAALTAANTIPFAEESLTVGQVVQYGNGWLFVKTEDGLMTDLGAGVQSIHDKWPERLCWVGHEHWYSTPRVAIIRRDIPNLNS